MAKFSVQRSEGWNSYGGRYFHRNLRSAALLRIWFVAFDSDHNFRTIGEQPMLILTKHEGLGMHLIYSLHNALNPRRTLIEKQWIIMKHLAFSQFVGNRAAKIQHRSWLCLESDGHHLVGIGYRAKQHLADVRKQPTDVREQMGCRYTGIVADDTEDDTQTHQVVNTRVLWADTVYRWRG